MSIRSKLFFSFLFLALMIVAMFSVRYYFSIKENELIREIVLEHEISTQLSGLSTAAQKIRRYEKEYFIYVNNPGKREKYAGEFSEARAEINLYTSRLKTIYTWSNKKDGLKVLSDWEEAINYYGDGFEALNQRVIRQEISDVQDANKAIQDYKNRFRVVLSGTAQSIHEHYKIAADKAELIKKYQNTSAFIFGIISAISVLLALFMSFMVPASIVKPLKQLTKIAEGISKGKMGNVDEVKGSIEIENLAKSIKRLQTATLGLLKRLQKGKNSSS